MRKFLRARLLVAGVGGAAVLVGATVALGHVGPVEQEVIHACVTSEAGTVRIVSADATCRPNERPLDWNAQGPAGGGGHEDVLVDCGSGQSVNEALEQTASAASVNITIRGTCTEHVVINPLRDHVVLRGETQADGISAPPDADAVSIRGVDGVQIENMTITGGENGVSINGAESVGLWNVDISGGQNGISVFADAEFATNQVTIGGFANTGIHVGGSSYGEVDNTSIEGGQFGIGVNGAYVHINGGTISGSEVFGVSVGNGGTVHVDGGAVVAGSGFHGVQADNGGSISVRHARVQLSGGTGVFAFQGGSVHVSQGAEILDNGHGGVGANAGTAQVSGGLVSGNTGSGVFGYNGGHVTIQNGALVQANAGDGLQLGVGSTGVVQGATIRDNAGNGISLNDTSVVGVNGASITGNTGLGIFCPGPPSVAMISPGSDLSGVSGGENCPGP